MKYEPSCPIFMSFSEILLESTIPHYRSLLTRQWVLANKMNFPYFCCIVTILGVALCDDKTPYSQLNQRLEQYSLPKLGFSDDMLEPYIDRATVENHHQGHHEAYRKKMNAALATWRSEVSMNKFSVYLNVTITLLYSKLAS